MYSMLMRNTKYLFSLLLFSILLNIFFLLESESKLAEKFEQNKVVLATGINFDTHQVVLVDPESAKEVSPCNPAADYQRQHQQNKSKKSEAPNCSAQFIIPEDNSNFSSVIELSNHPLEGQISKNGKVIPATYIVTLTALYKGSHCHVTGTNGSGGEKCDDGSW